MKRFLLRWTVDLWHRRTMSYREQMIQRVGDGRPAWTREEWACVIRFTAFLGIATRAMDDAAAATRQSARAFQAMADVIEEDDLWKAWSGINGTHQS